MSDSTGSPSDKGENGAAPDSAAIQKLIDDAVGKALAARLPRVKNTEETIAKMVADAIAKLPAPESAKAPVDNGMEPESKLTLKALQEQHRALEQKFQLEQKARQEADLRAKAAAQRSMVQAEFAKYVPADSPHHKPYMATLFDVEKRFAEGPDGKFGVKFTREWGDEIVGVEQGLKELFDTELKYLVTPPSKAPHLPPTGYRQANGNPYKPPAPQQNGQRVNPLFATIADAVGEHHPEAAAQILNAGILPNK